MIEPVETTRPKARVPDAPAAGDLSWRDFFARLGDGTLHDPAAAPESRAAPDQPRPARNRPPATAPR